MEVKTVGLKVENITGLPVYERMERAGRICYRSEDKIAEGSAKKFVQMVADNGHYSVLGHSQLLLLLPMEDAVDVDLLCPQHLKHQFTFIPHKDSMVVAAGFDSWLQLCQVVHMPFAIKLVQQFPEIFHGLIVDGMAPYDVDIFATDDSLHMLMEQLQYAMKETYVLTVDRATAMQLRTYRFATHSVESQRYVNYVKHGFTYIMPPEIADNTDMKIWWELIKNDEANNYTFLIEQGYKPEFARIVLGQDISTTMAITASLWEWRHIFHCRLNSHAQSNARAVVQMVKDDLLLRYAGTPIAKWLEE
jgi:thymidylate synthase (FAD)